MIAFITGSFAYGKPNEDSDIDLVIFCDEETKALLEKHSETNPKVSFGNLNLIICTTIEEYSHWALGTVRLTKEKDIKGGHISRKDATAYFRYIRQLFEIKEECQSGDANGDSQDRNKASRTSDARRGADNVRRGKKRNSD